MSRRRQLAIYAAGLFSGIGIVGASLSGATVDSIIPYTFKDGQVISADTLNDLFDQIKQGTRGYSSEAELNGAWSCKTYDPAPVGTRTAGMANMNYALDADSGILAVNQTWTFSNNGTALNMDKVKIGGVSANNTGSCPITLTSFDYSAKLIESTLMLLGSGGCIGGTGHALEITRVSPTKFRATTSNNVIVCTSTLQPPSSPVDLTATVASSGVSLTWTANGGNPSSYSVLKKSNGSYSSIATATSTSFTDTTGTVGDLYRIKAINSDGTSLASTAAKAN
jgi:hypothetical protein